MPLLRTLLLITLLSPAGIAFAKQAAAVDPAKEYYGHPLPLRTVPAQRWRDATQGLSYPEDAGVNQAEGKNTGRAKEKSGFSLGENTARTILFGLLLCVLSWAAYRLVRERFFLPAKIIPAFSPAGEISIDEDTPYPEIERLLQRALADKDFRLALRIYFLWTLRLLADRKLIRWKKDKTNREYLDDLRPWGEYSRFRELTLAFERTWYGERELAEPEFQFLRPGFLHLIRELNPFPLHAE